MFVSAKRIRKVYIPMLFEESGLHLASGEEYESEQDAENFAMAMVEDFVNETGDHCYATVEIRFIPVYVWEEE